MNIVLPLRAKLCHNSVIKNALLSKIFDKQDIYFTSNISSGSFLGYLNSACFLSLTLPTQLLQRTRRENIVRVYLLLVCLLPLLMCQANAAPRSWSESSSWREESHFNGKTIDTQGVHIKGSFLSWFVGLRCASTRNFCPALPWLLNIFFFLTVHYFTRKLGIQSCCGAYLCMCVYW